ncbi:WD40-repeat-containing domain protein [Scheffersomyces xylosifermentans]|uniref:WD40-repeat-containing domain protein n=1 Tax=Scheffersomyces xylosifermentans TaxID=1304137 RepID=UPI00315CC5F2
MSIVQGYSSSEDEEVPQLPVLPKYEIQTYTETHSVEAEPEISSSLVSTSAKRKKRKNFAGNAEETYYDSATFELHAKLEKRNKGPSNDVKSKVKKLKRKRTKKGAAEDDDYLGPWAKYSSDEEAADKQVRDNSESDVDVIPTKLEEDQEGDKNTYDSENDSGIEEKATSGAITTEFLGSNQFDYLGRTYMHIPRDLDVNLTKEPGSQECFVPKRVIHTFTGHSKGVTKLELFPKSGHLLLSAGNDGKIRLWDLYHKRELLRIFHGHSQSVKDVTFNSSGSEFLSCGFDKKIVLWNTETGEIKRTMKINAIPNVIKFNPNNEKEFIVGLSNNKIQHYDLGGLNSEEPVQTYDHHLGAINSLTIIDDNNRFMSTSDDKTVRFWDWRINIPIKFISDPSQHSMPTAAVYPGGNFIALQSMDNSIQVIQGHGKFKFNRKKTFKGHNVAGYGIGIDISPDGKIIMSGDSSGYGYFWDWKTCRLINKFKVSDKPISCIHFHPQETSKVLMAGTTGEIFYCD